MSKGIEFKSTAVISTEIPDIKLETDFVATVVGVEGETKNFTYDPTTPSGTLVRETFKKTKIDASKEETEIIIEKVEHSRGLIDGGGEISFGFSGFKFSVKRDPRTVTRTTAKTRTKR